MTFGAINDMAVFFNESTYNPDNFTERLTDCFMKWEDDDSLFKASDATWQGIFDMYSAPLQSDP